MGASSISLSPRMYIIMLGYILIPEVERIIIIFDMPH